MKTYRDLIVWQKTMQLVTETYKLTAGFPKEEIYALTSQIRRCAVSIPSNIAEGVQWKSLLSDYPELTIKDIRAAVLYATATIERKNQREV